MHGESLETLLGAIKKENVPKSEQLQLSDDDLTKLGKLMHNIEVPNVSPSEKIGAGYTYFGQFIDHDLVLSTNNCIDPSGNNTCCHGDYRKLFADRHTPHKLNLDPVYAKDDVYCKTTGKLRYRSEPSSTCCETPENHCCENANPIDLPRDKCKNHALIPDLRNDENWLISQFHLLFIKLHNRICGGMDLSWSAHKKFTHSKSACISIYRNIIHNDFLKTVLHPEVYKLYCDADFSVSEILDGVDNNQLDRAFSKAAFRYGHSMVLNRYPLRELPDQFPKFRQIKIEKILELPTKILGNQNIQELLVDWTLFFDTNDPNGKVRRALNKADPVGPAVKFSLPISDKSFKYLAVRNLIRAKYCHLETYNYYFKKFFKAFSKRGRFSNSTLTGLMNECQEDGELRLDFNMVLNGISRTLGNLIDHTQDRSRRITKDCPLWFGILCEAQIVLNKRATPNKSIGRSGVLGPVGSLIIADVFKRALGEVPEEKSIRADYHKISSISELIKFIN